MVKQLYKMTVPITFLSAICSSTLAKLIMSVLCDPLCSVNLWFYISILIYTSLMTMSNINLNTFYAFVNISKTLAYISIAILLTYRNCLLYIQDLCQRDIWQISSFNIKISFFVSVCAYYYCSFLKLWQ